MSNYHQQPPPQHNSDYGGGDAYRRPPHHNQRQQQQPYTKVYFGRLPPDCRERDFERLADEFGRIRNLRFKGLYGFVDYYDPRDARDCVRELDGSRFMGERISVEPAKDDRPSDRQDRPTDFRGRTIGHGPRLVVRNLPSGTSWQDLKDLMKTVGEVRYANVEDPRAGLGIVEFMDPQDRDAALQKFVDFDFKGAIITVEEDGAGGPSAGMGPPRSAVMNRDEPRRYSPPPPPPRRREEVEDREYPRSPPRSGMRDRSPPPPPAREHQYDVRSPIGRSTRSPPPRMRADRDDVSPYSRRGERDDVSR